MKQILRALCPAFLLFMLLFLSACAESRAEKLLPRANVSEVSLDFLGYQGEDIPRADIQDPSVLGQILDVFYAAEPVRLDIPMDQSYSPELSASQLLYLRTSAGALPVYYNNAQKLFAVPYIREDDGTQLRDYRFYQVQQESQTAFSDLLSSLEPPRPSAETPAV
ncbi:MAG: hypothetical protein LBD02_09810 [Christensenellaceae bacterium]|jgi:hypothetical protein|nr:hypothetical protein [Christensenellaceae bacterium]